MKLATLIIFFFTSASLLMAQTKLIRHKSHSGTSACFISTVTVDILDNKGFGLSPSDRSKAKAIDMRIENDNPNHILKMAVLDSVMYISDTVTALAVTTYYTTFSYPDSLLVKSDVFTLDHSSVTSIDTIKKVISKQNYAFGNSVEKVKYIGYDTIKPVKMVRKKNKNGFLPVIPQDIHQPPFDIKLLMYMGSIALFSSLAGLLSWKIYQIKILIYKA